MSVSSFLIHIHISEPISTKLCTHLPLGLEETVGYYGPTILHLPHLFDLFCRERVANAAQKMPAGVRGIPRSVISVIPERIRVTSRACIPADNTCAF
jgi:hypothetical protein